MSAEPQQHEQQEQQEQPQDQHHVYTSKLSTLRNKITKLLQDGPTKVKVVTDFDFTISTPSHCSSWQVVERSPYLSAEYREKVKALGKHYYPIEVSPTLSLEEKSAACEEWWRLAVKAIADEKVTRRQYQEILQFSLTNIVFRDHVEALLRRANDQGVKVLIFSAGIGDAIDVTLLQHCADFYTPLNPYFPTHLLLNNNTSVINTTTNSAVATAEDKQDEKKSAIKTTNAYQPQTTNTQATTSGAERNVYMISNHLNFDNYLHDAAAPQGARRAPDGDEDVIVGFINDPPIHVFNKVEGLVMQEEYYSTHILPRNNVLLMGDSLGDAQMCVDNQQDNNSNAPNTTTTTATSTHNNVIRIGMINTSMGKSREVYLPKYLEMFDVVFVDCDLGVKFSHDILGYFVDGEKAASGLSIEEFVTSLLAEITVVE